jgi:uncharacterized oxidoreductase
MILTGNTIFITGGGSGIGRGLAEALNKLGNKVVISGRNRAALDAVVAANPGIDAIELDVANSESIRKVAAKLIADYPSMNTLINNAGIMLFDDASRAVDEAELESQVATNLTGTIRLTSALIEQLKKQAHATIVYNSSTLAFTPLAMFAIYSATKAALHSYAMSQRFMLRATSVAVKEIAPPWVGTGLVGAADDPRAVPVARFVSDTLAVLATDADEILVEEAKIYRNSAGPAEYAFIENLNIEMSQVFAR